MLAIASTDLFVVPTTSLWLMFGFLIMQHSRRELPWLGVTAHNAPSDYKFKLYTVGQKRRVTPQIKREFKRRAAIEPTMGHPKAEHRMGRNYLAHRAGDAINAVLAAAGYNFGILLRWLKLLLHAILLARVAQFRLQTT